MLILSRVLEGEFITKTSPWFSAKRKIYHNNTACKTGNNIFEKENLRSGSGGKRLCWECTMLNDKGI
jgi:hypothetical protein